MIQLTILFALLPFIRIMFFGPKYKTQRSTMATVAWFGISWFISGAIYLLGV